MIPNNTHNKQTWSRNKPPSRNLGHRGRSTSPRLLVEIFYIPIFADFQRAIAIYFCNIFRTNRLPHPRGTPANGKIKGVRTITPTSRKSLTILAIRQCFQPDLETVAQITAKTTQDIVPVKNKRTASHRMERFLDNLSQRKFTRPGQAGKPKVDGPLTVQMGFDSFLLIRS